MIILKEKQKSLKESPPDPKRFLLNLMVAGGDRYNTGIGYPGIKTIFKELASLLYEVGRFMKKAGIESKESRWINPSVSAEFDVAGKELNDLGKILTKYSNQHRD
jgi:hypothetical protein